MGVSGGLCPGWQGTTPPPPSPFPRRGFSYPLRPLFSRPGKKPQAGGGGIPRVALRPRVGWEIICAGADRDIPQGLTSKLLLLPPASKAGGSAGLDIKRGGSSAFPVTCLSQLALLRVSQAYLCRQVGARPRTLRQSSTMGGQET